jgi:hypothetical protein
MTHSDTTFNPDNLVNEPDAPRLIHGLRDTGYDFRTAAADIVDNSIAAGADDINIRIDLLRDGRKFVYFGDNGGGMDGHGVFDAMRYGAPRRKNLKSLGKFGLGLKTASSSVCKRFTLISKNAPNAENQKLTWDLDHVQIKERWEMCADPLTLDERDAFEELCGEGPGTLIVWEKCDRLLTRQYDEPGGTKEKNAIRRLSEGLREHLGMIFHRFLDGKDKRERNISITVDGIAVTPWDPFFREKSEQVLSDKQKSMEIQVEDGSTYNAQISAWVLPHNDDLTEKEKKIARISNRAQGFYIYREGRLISNGGWLGVFGSREPHMSLLRIEFDFGYELDEAFSIDVKKSRILLDPALSDYLEKLISPARREANLRYRKKSQRTAANTRVDHTSANRAVENTPNTDKATVENADSSSQKAVVTNNRGTKIVIRQKVENDVGLEHLSIDAVETITSGDLWEPSFRSAGSSGHVPAVLLNKHHDFYQKIYLRAANSGYSVQGMDLLLWAFAVAEQNNTNEELDPIFADIRQEISTNLRKLLRDVPTPEAEDLKDTDSPSDVET